MVSQTGPRVVRSNSCKGPVYPGKGPKKSHRAKRKFWGQQVLFGAKYLKFGPKRANLAILWCHAVISLRFTHVPSSCRGGLRNLRADCSTVGLYFVRIVWQQIFKGSLHIMVTGVLLPCWMQTWQVMQRDVSADSGKPRTFLLREKKQEWICSNASTSLKNQLLVRVWPMWLSVKIHLRRLFSHAAWKHMRLARIRLCRLVGIRLNRFGSDIWVNPECKAVFAVASFHNSCAEFVKPVLQTPGLGPEHVKKTVLFKVRLFSCFFVNFILRSFLFTHTEIIILTNKKYFLHRALLSLL